MSSANSDQSNQTLFSFIYFADTLVIKSNKILLLNNCLNRVKCLKITSKLYFKASGKVHQGYLGTKLAGLRFYSNQNSWIRENWFLSVIICHLRKHSLSAIRCVGDIFVTNFWRNLLWKNLQKKHTVKDEQTAMNQLWLFSIKSSELC